jgi:hypothetical protein
MFVTGAAAVTVVVLAQRHARSSVKAEEGLSGPASDSTPRGALAEQLRANAPTPPRPQTRPIGFDPDPESEPDSGVASPSSDTVRGEAYDAVSTDDLAAEWLARATESQSPRPSDSREAQYRELTTLDLLDDDPLSTPTLETEPDESEAVLESEAARSDPNPEDLHAHPGRPRPPPGVFDIADLTQEEDAPRGTGRRS